VGWKFFWLGALDEASSVSSSPVVLMKLLPVEDTMFATKMLLTGTCFAFFSAMILQWSYILILIRKEEN
jgi:hypothetical protein